MLCVYERNKMMMMMIYVSPGSALT